MKVLVVHNRYKDRTGEDSVFDREVSLLRAHSNQVDIWTVDNRAVKAGTALEKISLAKSTIWSRKANKELSEKLLVAKPDIVHVHNTLPLLSPSIFHACHRANIPVVHTLHNYRLICPSNTLFRDGQICEKCVSGTLLNSVRYGCYRSSRTQTAAVAAMLQYHRWINTWSHRIDGYIALSEFQKTKIVASGIAEDKIYIKPNFIESIPQETTKVEFGSYYLFVGRLIDEKGVRLLIEGYKKANSKYPLIIMGPGYLQEMVTQAALEDERIKYVGIQSKEDVLSWMKGAIALLFPSVWHECSPMTILEAFSCSLPVICSSLGALLDMVEHQKTGYIFSPASAKELTEAIIWVENNKQSWLFLKQHIIQRISTTYFKEENYKRLIQIYEQVIRNYVYSRRLTIGLLKGQNPSSSRVS